LFRIFPIPAPRELTTVLLSVVGYLIGDLG
jgi:hypothetical protein